MIDYSSGKDKILFFSVIFLKGIVPLFLFKIKQIQFGSVTAEKGFDLFPLIVSFK
jgi:hypothetical protein